MEFGMEADIIVVEPRGQPSKGKILFLHGALTHGSMYEAFWRE
jgi:hypothetical protein